MPLTPNAPEIFLAAGNVLSIAFFNFAGISVTKELSSTTRMVLDSGRTLIIWVASLALQWQAFYPLQIIGRHFGCVMLLPIAACRFRSAGHRHGYLQRCVGALDQPVYLTPTDLQRTLATTA